METAASKVSPNVVIGVGAGIAAYKVAHVVRGFRRLGWEVYVVPTPASLEFVGSTTWRELSENPVQTEVFHGGDQGHVELARNADLIVLAPATADLLARARAGMANDLLTATLLASAAPVIAFPAMHTNMWQHPATVENVSVLRARRWSIITPDDGNLSSGDTGPGRMPEPEVIIERARALYASRSGSTGPLAGKRIVVTAGGTREALDPVRFIGNRSSGRQGVALAEEAAKRGAEVVLVSGAVEVPLPTDDERITVLSAPTAVSMLATVQDNLKGSDALIMCAAVGDFAPLKPSEEKIKKTDEAGTILLELAPNPDILATVSKSDLRPAVLVGFGAETGDATTVQRLGSEKAVRKGADLLAVNRVGEGVGFGNVASELFYFDAEGKQIGSAAGSKDALASDLLDRVTEFLSEGVEG